MAFEVSGARMVLGPRLYEDQIVAFTLGHGDRTRIWSKMTAAMPEYRGRGLAKLVKSAALHRAAGGARTLDTIGGISLDLVPSPLKFRRENGQFEGRSHQMAPSAEGSSSSAGAPRMD